MAPLRATYLVIVCGCVIFQTVWNYSPTYSEVSFFDKWEPISHTSKSSPCFHAEQIFPFSFSPKKKKNTVLFKYFLYLPSILFAIQIHSSHLVLTRRWRRRLWYVFMNRKQSLIRFLFQADLTAGRTHPVSQLLYSAVAFDWKSKTTRLYENILLVNITCEPIKRQRQQGVRAERSNDVKFIKRCFKLRNQITGN